MHKSKLPFYLVLKLTLLGLALFTVFAAGHVDLPHADTSGLPEAGKAVVEEAEIKLQDIANEVSDIINSRLHTL